MARRARPTRGVQAESATVASPYIRRALPFYDPLDEAQLEQLETQVRAVQRETVALSQAQKQIERIVQSISAVKRREI